MATYSARVRRGLPRVTGGLAWPVGEDVPHTASPVGESSLGEARAPRTSADQPPTSEPSAARSAPDRQSTLSSASLPPNPEIPAGASGHSRRVRSGLPRVAGGLPWPPARSGADDDADGRTFALDLGASPAAAVWSPRGAAPSVAQQSHPVEGSEVRSATDGVAPTATGGVSFVALRRGLPRVPGREPWPPAGVAPLHQTDRTSTVLAEESAVGRPRPVVPSVTATPNETGAPGASAVAPLRDRSIPLPFTRTAWHGSPGRVRPSAPSRAQRIGPFTKGQWAGVAVVGGAGLLIAAAMAVLAVRWLLSLEPLRDFLTSYPGEYHLPEGAPVGFPAWLAWQHFFNVFLMVLIIRTGLQIRTDKRPAVFWTPRRGQKGKISLTIWLHQSLDVLWLLNGIAFVVLLFVSGQWMRIVPTSWEVFPNALSATMQYMSLDWPTENGWVNYNALQQIAYFTTVFIAAPLSAVTGYRMSNMWPKGAVRLNAAYPIEWARKIHFPVMLYFVVFIFVHVALVLATGALRNLNHMYAARGSTDPAAYAGNWTGFWIFTASMAVIAAAIVAARPLVVAPIARLFGSVSGR